MGLGNGILHCTGAREQTEEVVVNKLTGEDSLLAER